mgnify:CR=1 FL=1
MASDNHVLIKDIVIDKDSIFISFDVKASENVKIEAWLENKNKYKPHIFNIYVDNEKQSMVIENQALNAFINTFSSESFKLSLSTPTKRIKYKVPNHLREVDIIDISILPTEDFLLFNNKKLTPATESLIDEQVDIQHKNKLKFESINKLPIEVLNIGSCFSRSIFKTDEYFNPRYKEFFHIKKTLFHNSFISIFSNAVDYNFSSVEDLTTGDAVLYMEIEFKKNIDKQFINNNFKLVIVDNYIDATSPIIKYGSNSFLTYNKYLAESIFKRLISSYEIIYPGTQQHLELYRESIINFRNILTKYHVKNVVLIGGRQSQYKINEQTNQLTQWNDKMEWILNVNRNWDKVDKIFLEEIPNSIYIDKRKTKWKSDVLSPMIGGASPSHYQGEYYKELFNDIMSFLNRDLIDEKRDY